MEDKKTQQLRKAVSEGEALQALEGMLGWKLVHNWLKESVETSQDKVFNQKVVKNWNDFMDMRGAYSFATKLLFKIEQKKTLAMQAKKELESEPKEKNG